MSLLFCPSKSARQQKAGNSSQIIEIAAMDGGTTSVDAMRKCSDDLKEVFTLAVQRQSEQTAQLKTLQHECEVQEEKLAKLQTELGALKQLVATKKTTAPAPVRPGVCVCV